MALNSPRGDLGGSDSALERTEPRSNRWAHPRRGRAAELWLWLPSGGCRAVAPATEGHLQQSGRAAASSSTATRGAGPAVVRTMLGTKGVVVPASGEPSAAALPRRRGRCATNATLLGPVEVATHTRRRPPQSQLTISPTVAPAPATAPREGGPRTCQ